MKPVTKGDLDPLIREIAVLLAEKYPNLPWTIGIHTSDGQNFARAASHFLQDDLSQIRAYAEYIKHALDIVNRLQQTIVELEFLKHLAVRKDTTVN